MGLIIRTGEIVYLDTNRLSVFSSNGDRSPILHNNLTLNCSTMMNLIT